MSADQRSREAINFSWLVRLRWAAIAGQLATIIGVTRLFEVRLPLPGLGVVLAIEAVSNIVCTLAARRGRPAEWWSGGVMMADTLLLTALLYLTGGAYNPFSFFYLVQIALAAVILSARWVWPLVLLSLAGSGILFVAPSPLEGLSHAQHMALHLRGMWVAFSVAASFIVYFLLRVRHDLEAREGELEAARQLGERQQRLASLATLAAGAAHELATPLSTIAIAASELERRLSTLDENNLREDVQLIRSEVGRCRQILDSMAAEAGQTAGEGLSAVDIRALLEGVVKDARHAPQVEIEVVALGDAPMTLPRRALAQAIKSLVENAQDASPEAAPVRLVAGREAGALYVDVIDRGAGMSATVLARAGEPFFTTKAPGRGMGLGLFLTRTLVESLGGSLELRSRVGEGTRVRLRLSPSVPL